MAIFNSSMIKKYDEQVYFKLHAKKESHLSVNNMKEYFPASDTFVVGMLNLAHSEAVSSFEDFYNKVSNDPEEMEEDITRYLELLNYLKDMDLKNFDIYYRMSDTFLRMSIPQAVIFFLNLHKAFIKEE